MIVPAFAESTQSGRLREKQLQELETKSQKQKEEFETKSKEMKDKVATKSQELKDKFASREAELKDKFASKSAKLKERCEEINKKVQEGVTKYTENKTEKVAKYVTLKARTEELIVKLKTQGYDTTKLEADLKTLDTKIQKATTDYDAFLKSLKDATSTITCDTTTGNFGLGLGKAKQGFATVRTDHEDIKKFVQTNLKADLQAAKAFIKEHRSASPKASSTATPTPSAVPTASPNQ
jgi:chromosome segregation ATPase